MSDLDKVNGAIKIPDLQKAVSTKEVMKEEPISETPQPEPLQMPAVKETEKKPLVEKLPFDDQPPAIKEVPEVKVIIAEAPVVKVLEEIIPESAPEIAVPETLVLKQEAKKPEKKDKKPGIDLFAEAQKGTLADSFKTEQKPLHEKLSQDKTEKPLVEKIQHTAIKDLKASIGINERFLFINELFKGNMQQYNSAIEQLNTFTVATDAFSLLESLKASNGWENKLETYSQLEDFVMRKFLAG